MCFRQKSRAGVQGAPVLAVAVPVKGPDEEKIKLILARTGYTLDVTTGQLKCLIVIITVINHVPSVTVVAVDCLIPPIVGKRICY